MASRSRTRTSRERFDDEPLRHASGALSIDVETFSLDDDDQSFEVDKAGNQVFLENWEDDWKTLTLEGTLTIDDDLEPVFPPDEWPADAPAEVVVAVECEYTHIREGRSIDVDSFEQGTTEFEVTFSSRNVYGTVQLTPFVVRTEDADTTGDYRTHAGLELADGEPWMIHIDETEDSSGPLLPPIFKSFEESDNDERFPNDAVYVVDKTKLESPKLYVNRDHESIASALNSGPRGELGRAMNVYTDAILLPALSELVVWTAEDVDETGEPEHDWQEDLLAQIVTKMYDVNSAVDAGERLHEEFDAGGRVPELLNKTSIAIQEYLEMSDDMTKLVDSIRS
jgi:hypothetical protein